MAKSYDELPPVKDVILRGSVPEDGLQDELKKQDVERLRWVADQLEAATSRLERLNDKKLARRLEGQVRGVSERIRDCASQKVDEVRRKRFEAAGMDPDNKKVVGMGGRYRGGTTMEHGGKYE